MKDRILIVSIILFFLIPFRSAFAEIIYSPEPYSYDNGLLDDSVLQEFTTNGLEPYHYDNNLTTSQGARTPTGGRFYIDFETPVNINQMYLKMTTYESNGTYQFNIKFLNGTEQTHTFIADFTGFYDLNYENVTQISVFGTDRTSLYEIEFFGNYDSANLVTDPTPKVENVGNISVTPTYNSLTFNYELPEMDNFSHVRIVANGKEYQTTKNSFTLEGLEENTEYTATFYTVATDGTESPGAIVTAKTLENTVPEILNVNVETTYNRVDLSWQLPNNEDFNHVKIYRKTLEEQTAAASFIDSLFGVKTAYASEIGEYEPLFETNGTYFNDLTVKPSSKYEYRLTTVTTEGTESEGVIVIAETDPEPPPKLVGGGYTKDENGDYIFSWTEPTDGKVKILIDGNEYQTVDAALKKILIPKEQMKYDPFNNPLVTLIPISSSGKEGIPADIGKGTFDNIDLPFTVKDMLKVGLALIGIVAAFVLLGLAFRFVPKFISMVLTSFRNGRTPKTDREIRLRRGG